MTACGPFGFSSYSVPSESVPRMDVGGDKFMDVNRWRACSRAEEVKATQTCSLVPFDRLVCELHNQEAKTISEVFPTI